MEDLEEQSDQIRSTRGSRCTDPRARISLRARRLRRDGQDEAAAEKTLPRDGHGEPAVDPDLWLVHVHYARTQEPALRAELVDEYSGYATSIAWRLHRDGEPIDDLMQIALEALIVALQRFDPARGIPFTGFATPTIVGSLKRHYRDNGWAIRVPRRVHELAAPARRQSEELAAVLGRQPTSEEIAGALGVSPDRIAETNAATYARSVASLDTSARTTAPAVEVPGVEDHELSRAENHLALRQALQHLSAHERKVLKHYFIEELTQSEIAEIYEISQMQVSRWVSAAIKRLRSHMLTDC